MNRTVTMQAKRNHRQAVKDKLEQIDAKVSTSNVFYTAAASIGFVYFGAVAIECALMGGVLWVFAIPYGIMSLCCLGWGIWLGSQIIR